MNTRRLQTILMGLQIMSLLLVIAQLCPVSHKGVVRRDTIHQIKSEKYDRSPVTLHFVSEEAWEKLIITRLLTDQTYTQTHMRCDERA